METTRYGRPRTLWGTGSGWGECGEQGLDLSVLDTGGCSFLCQERFQEWVLRDSGQSEAAVETEAKGKRRVWEGAADGVGGGG